MCHILSLSMDQHFHFSNHLEDLDIIALILLIFSYGSKGTQQSNQEVKISKVIHGVKIGGEEPLTHFKFVDDVLLFCSANKDNFFYEILQLYNRVTSMEASLHKYDLNFNNIQDGISQTLLGFPPYRYIVFWEGFIYLGFNLTPRKQARS